VLDIVMTMPFADMLDQYQFAVGEAVTTDAHVLPALVETQM
jgi:hypothetical protein